jgi:hypothetical protein
VLGRYVDATPDRRSFDRFDLVNEIAQRRINDAAEFVSTAGRIEKNERTESAEGLSGRLRPVPAEHRRSA